MGEYYILKGKQPVLEPDVIKWAVWQGDIGSRRVAFTKVAPGIEVSTVFLGLNHQFGEGEPLLFETMVFGGKLDQEQCRYTTWDQAEQGHREMVERVKIGT